MTNHVLGNAIGLDLGQDPGGLIRDLESITELLNSQGLDVRGIGIGAKELVEPVSAHHDSEDVLVGLGKGTGVKDGSEDPAGLVRRHQKSKGFNRSHFAIKLNIDHGNRDKRNL